ncbi:hypothetical protein BDP81DRAFT_147219 [Colletotrichum phormii]|uniref:Uncharacterized protein n=1 Tax=Colletotrichum phormii TaxID=359342 RepID=A0AAI9ZDJ7_9PEZI|nr:uncharacterized protein BDP81DRAFT_147219 [Colletotrichum phormii]KAK1622564.1 hypothetical protein BDP81DRAFT_147219 [Colletotrichum phormii]
MARTIFSRLLRPSDRRMSKSGSFAKSVITEHFPPVPMSVSTISPYPSVPARIETIRVADASGLPPNSVPMPWMMSRKFLAGKCKHWGTTLSLSPPSLGANMTALTKSKKTTQMAVAAFLFNQLLICNTEEHALVREFRRSFRRQSTQLVLVV